jgi:hypothetical protein
MTKNNTQNTTRNHGNDNTVSGLNDYEVDTVLAWNQPDSGLWCFGAVYSANDGVVLVLDPTRNPRECISRTTAIANPMQECVMVTGPRIHLDLFLGQVQKTFAGNEIDPDCEIGTFKSVLSMYGPLLSVVTLQNKAQANTDPVAGKYPANVSVPARRIWDNVTSSKKYLELSQGKSGTGKWNLITKLFLDKCNRLNVTPFETATKSLAALSEKYARQRNLAALLERQVFNNLEAEGLVENLDRGVWKFLKTDYVDKRYAVVLETRWLSTTKQPTLIAKHITGEEHFTKSPTGGWEHNVSPTCKLLVRIRRYPDISFRMVLLFSKDILTDLGIAGRNRDELLENFEEVARNWSRTKRFKKAVVG